MKLIQPRLWALPLSHWARLPSEAKGMVEAERDLPRWYHRYDVAYTQLDKFESRQFIPIHLGAILNKRYRVTHKLGTGSKSEIWLARDLRCDRWVSLKFLPCEQAPVPREVAILQLLQEQTTLLPTQRGSQHFIKLLDCFKIDHMDKFYHGIVMEVAGQTLNQWQEEDPSDISFKKSIVLQILSALQFLHKAEIAHGDASLPNICFSTPLKPEMSEEDVMALLGKPQMLPVIRLDGKPKPDCLPDYTVEPAHFRCTASPVKLIDFGEAWQFDSPPETLHIKSMFRPPELLRPSRSQLYKSAADMWMLGCNLLPLFGGAHLFDTLEDEEHYKEIETLTNGTDVSNWEEKIPEMEVQDRLQLIRLLKTIIVKDPRERFTAEQVARDQWLSTP